jgi:hypothetical protein
VVIAAKNYHFIVERPAGDMMEFETHWRGLATYQTTRVVHAQAF